jgi:hypothetical protein
VTRSAIQESPAMPTMRMFVVIQVRHAPQQALSAGVMSTVLFRTGRARVWTRSNIHHSVGRSLAAVMPREPARRLPRRSQVRLQLWASLAAAARDDVHECDQGDDYHCGDSDYGNRGCAEDHPSLLSSGLLMKPVALLQRRDTSRQGAWCCCHSRRATRAMFRPSTGREPTTITPAASAR